MFAVAGSMLLASWANTNGLVWTKNVLSNCLEAVGYQVILGMLSFGLFGIDISLYSNSGVSAVRVFWVVFSLLALVWCVVELRSSYVKYQHQGGRRIPNFPLMVMRRPDTTKDLLDTQYSFMCVDCRAEWTHTCDCHYTKRLWDLKGKQRRGSTGYLASEV